MSRDRSDMETWETTTESSVSINTYDAKGNVKAVTVGGGVGRKVRLTTDEREELNEDEVPAEVADLQCIFRNGFLRPVRGVPEAVMERFASRTKRAGGLSSEELLEILEIKGNAFHTRIGTLNEATLRRLKGIAPEADATASQIAAIDQALSKYLISGPEGLGARQTVADRIVHAGPRDLAPSVVPAAV